MGKHERLLSDPKLRFTAPLEQRRALLIINRNAKQGIANIDRLAGQLMDAGISVVPAATTRAEDVSRTIAERRHEVDCIVACGGDGTINSCARGLMETGLPLGIIPLGTANDLARTLGIPSRVEGAADVIARGTVNSIDIGTVNGHPFFNVASIGLSADLASGLTREVKRLWGRLSYARAAIAVLMNARPFSASIRNKDGVARVKTLQIAVGNGRHYGGGNVVQESAAIDDGYLDLYSLELRTVWKLALMSRAFRSGSHGAWSEVRTARCIEFDIETREPKDVNTDGELVTRTPAHFKIHPSAVRVYVPGSDPIPSFPGSLSLDGEHAWRT